MAIDAARNPRPRRPAKTDVCRLCVAFTRTRGHGLKAWKVSAFLEIRV
jgi:hypothetical protein